MTVIRSALMVIQLDTEHVQESTIRLQEWFSTLSNTDNQQYLALHLAIDDSAEQVLEVLRAPRQSNGSRSG